MFFFQPIPALELDSADDEGHGTGKEKEKEETKEKEKQSVADRVRIFAFVDRHRLLIYLPDSTGSFFI